MIYVGAGSRLPVREGLTLPAAWAYAPKVDGVYAEIVTDLAGRICSVASRNGRPLAEGADLLGIVAAPPRSLLVGELEAHTEAGVAAFARQGFRRLHLFDALAIDGTSIARLPYLERWGWLHRAQSVVESEGLGFIRSWRDDFAPATSCRPYPIPIGRDLTTGRLCRRIPRDLRRLPIVPLVRGHAGAAELWRDVEAGTLEGIVAVRLDARAGARDAKRKIKLVDNADCKVLDTSPGLLRLSAPTTSPAGWRGESFVVQSSRPAAIGSVVEVAHDGCYGSGLPRFPRVVRTREDLQP